MDYRAAENIHKMVGSRARGIQAVCLPTVQVEYEDRA